MPAVLEDFIVQLTEIEDELSNFVWSLNTPIRDFAPKDQRDGMHAELDAAQKRIQDDIDLIYRLVRDVQDEAMRVRRAA